jgi:hypothetical protein
MQLTKNDIAHKEEIGVYKNQPVIHIRTKGGYNYIALHKNTGELKILGEGSHRLVSKAMADNVQPGIQWHESLFKSELAKVSHKPTDAEYEAHMESLKNKPHESTPENHKAQADWHAKFAHFHNDQRRLKEAQGKGGVHALDNHLSGEWHKNEAIKHYQMAGMDRNQAHKTFENTKDYNMAQHPEGHPIFTDKQPFFGEKLAGQYSVKNKGQVPKGHLKDNFFE